MHDHGGVVIKETVDMTNTADHRGTGRVAQRRESQAPAAIPGGTSGTNADARETLKEGTHNTVDAVQAKRTVQRGLTNEVSSSKLRSAIWTRALCLANRFRVIRTIDIAAACFPEREFKAALTAAQRAVRGMVKAKLLRRYRTDRFQTVYGLTQSGAQWLHEADIEASASVRRVSDMTNPEHRMWAQFIVICAEARGLRAQTEIELLQELNRDTETAQPAVQGPLRVQVTTAKGTSTKFLRPDAIYLEADGAATWTEVDRSARGSQRCTLLRALICSVGAKLVSGQPLRRVIVFTRTERIHKRVLALLAQVIRQTAEAALVRGRRQIRETRPGEYEVWMTSDRKHRNGNVSLVDIRAGYIIVQALPVWLPRVRLDGRGDVSTAGWMSENYLPYRRPSEMPAWTRPTSPLLASSALPQSADKPSAKTGSLNQIQSTS